MTNTVTIGRADEVRAYEPAPRPAAYGLPDPIREAVYEAIRAQGEAGPVRCSVSLTRPTPGGVSTVTKFNFTVA